MPLEMGWGLQQSQTYTTTAGSGKPRKEDHFFPDDDYQGEQDCFNALRDGLGVATRAFDSAVELLE